MTIGAVTLGNDSCNLSCNTEKPSVAVLRDKFHEGFYIRQCFLQLNCLALNGDEQCRGLVRLLDWLMPQNVAIHVAGSMLHFATLENSVSALQEMLQKVEPSSTVLATIAATKKLRGMFVAGYITLGNFHATCVATKLRDKLRETLPGVKAPYIEQQILASPIGILKERCG